MSNLVTHARRELDAAGFFDDDSDYGGMLGDAVVELVEVFAKQGHSGMSASMVLNLFEQVANFKALTPITSNPEEWMVVFDNTWQNRRQSEAFSEDGGKTYHLLSENRRWIPRRVLLACPKQYRTRLMYPIHKAVQG